MSLPIPSAASGPIPAHQAVPKDLAKSQVPGQAEDTFSFFDFLDIVNPLQHIPIVSSIYRELTGDTIKGPGRVLGGALFGGPIGAVLGGINAVVASENKGKDIGELAMNRVGIGKDDKAVTAEKQDKTIPLIEVHPSDAAVLVSPIEKMPFAVIAQADIVWDVASPDMVVADAVLPQAKELNQLKPVAGLDPVFDEMPIVESDVVTIDTSLDERLSRMAAASSESAVPAAAPIEPGQIPNQMMNALSKYQAMQNISDKAVIVSAAPVEKERVPFSGLDKTIRRVHTR